MKDEVCIIPSTWWDQPFGFEVVSNARQPCCSPPASSSYSAHDVLLPMVQAGHRFGWLKAVRTGNAAIDFALGGSGGNALQAALSLCDSVDVYGVGLRNSGPGLDADKSYNHYWDDTARDCTRYAASHARQRGGRKASEAHATFYSDRLHTELLMHVMHGVGMVRWVQ